MPRLRPSLDWLLVLVPISIALELAGGDDLLTILVFMISSDGRSNWLEGAQLTGAYVIMAISLFFVEAL